MLNINTIEYTKTQALETGKLDEWKNVVITQPIPTFLIRYVATYSHGAAFHPIKRKPHLLDTVKE